MTFIARIHVSLPKSCRTVAAAFVLWLIGLPPSHAQAELLAPEHTAGVDLTDPDVIFQGGEMFNGMCAGYCHGTDGTAKRGPALRNRAELDESTLYHVILKGRRRSGNPMPPWEGLLSDEQIWTIIAYIISLRDAPPLHATGADDPE